MAKAGGNGQGEEMGDGQHRREGSLDHPTPPPSHNQPTPTTRAIDMETVPAYVSASSLLISSTARTTSAPGPPPRSTRAPHPIVHASNSPSGYSQSRRGRWRPILRGSVASRALTHRRLCRLALPSRAATGLLWCFDRVGSRGGWEAIVVITLGMARTGAVLGNYGEFVEAPARFGDVVRSERRRSRVSGRRTWAPVSGHCSAVDGWMGCALPAGDVGRWRGMSRGGGGHQRVASPCDESCGPDFPIWTMRPGDWAAGRMAGSGTARSTLGNSTRRTALCLFFISPSSPNITCASQTCGSPPAADLPT